MNIRYQVFISSTYTDLKEERQLIMEALLSMNCIPVGMELFPAADQTQLQLIEKIIDDSDYYLLIIGGRYGSTASDGISYTEKEYNYAKEKNLKIIPFIHENPGQIPLDKSEKDMSLITKLENFKSKIMYNHTVKFWTSSHDLSIHVIKSIAYAMKVSPATGWVRADQVSNHELLKDNQRLNLNNEELRKENNKLQLTIANLNKNPSEYRIELLKSFILIASFIYICSQRNIDPFTKDQELSEKLSTIQLNFELYGYEDEIKLINSFVAALIAKNTELFSKSLHELLVLARSRLRKELGFEATSPEIA